MPKKKKLRLITFDVDDTLYSSTGFVQVARRNAINAMIGAGLLIDPDEALAELNEIITEFTSNDEHHFDRLLQRLPSELRNGVNSAVLIAAAVASYHDAVHNNFTAYEDVMECIKGFQKKGYRMGVISQGYTIKQATKLVRLRILPYLDKRAIFISDQMGMSKGNPKFFQRASAIMKAEPGQCMHVGDRPDRDIDPANRAGWVTVLNRRSGKYHERPAPTPPAHIIHNFWDLAEVLEKNFEPA